MKYLNYLTVLVFLFSFSACNEIAPEINPVMETDNDLVVEPVPNQERQVLIEEFTGVTCVNCPAGSAAIEDLIDEHAEQLVAISIHAGSFSNPYSDSEIDFRTTAGNNLLNFLGIPLGYPTAVIDRKQFEGEFDLQLFRSQWAGYIENQLEEDPKVKIGIAKAFDTDTRQLDIKVGLFIEETITEDDVRISVAILENDIVDVQLTPDGKDYDYKHKHVLREMITAFDGNIIGEPLEAGGVVERDFTVTLSEDYVDSKCTIIAFVNLGGETIEVLQATQVKILN